MRVLFNFSKLAILLVVSSFSLVFLTACTKSKSTANDTNLPELLLKETATVEKPNTVNTEPVEILGPTKPSALLEEIATTEESETSTDEALDKLEQ